jgi:hypothetical protein
MLNFGASKGCAAANLSWKTAMHFNYHKLRVGLFGLVLFGLSACGSPDDLPAEQDLLTPVPVAVTTPAKAEIVVCTTAEPASLFGDRSADLIWQAMELTARGHARWPNCPIQKTVA